MDSQLPKTLPAFIWHFLKPYKLGATLFFCTTILTGLWGPLNNILIKHIIDSLPLVYAGDTSFLIWPAVLIVLNFVVFDNITWRLISYLDYNSQAAIKNRIISETSRFVLNNSHQFFQDSLSGRISSQIMVLADNIQVILHRIIRDFIRGFSVLAISLVASYFVNPIFFYILLIWFITFSSFSILMSKHLVFLADSYAAEESSLAGQLVDSITNQSNVRVFAKKEYEISRLRKFFLQLEKTFRAKEVFLIVLDSIQGLMITLMMAFSLYRLTYLYGKGLISVGDFALILGLFMQVAHTVWYMMSCVSQLSQAVGKCKQSLSSLLVDPQVTDKANAYKLKVTKGQIIFESVTFNYKGAQPLFQSKSVVIEPGQKVGLVGYSGSGKSSFANLILRFYDVTHGRILIDNQDIRDVTQDSLHSNIGMIPQDPSLFCRTVMDNIRYGQTEATDEQVIKAAQRAHAHEFICSLPQGYNSLAGERGTKLSGGQRQRIAIARALLKNAPILILDEATSQLDSITETLIQESLGELMQGKTTVVIAHRLSTLLHMDRILVFDKGKIMEDGTHTQLLQANGLYKTLWNAQVGGFLPNKRTEI